MQIIHERCVGLDVHTKTVVACLIIQGRKQVRTFSTMTDDLLQLADWLTAQGCTVAAVESTGVYWKPVFHILEATLQVLLVNAHEVKALPGRKTDVRDCEWLADLLRHGLLKASFIPPPHIRELRDLTRYRHQLVKEQTATANRIQKLIESYNIKLAQVASDALGVSGRAILRTLAQGEEDVVKMGQLAQGALRRKIPAIHRALKGFMSATQRWVLNELLDRYDALEASIARVNERIDHQMEFSPDPFVPQAASLLRQVPGIGDRVTQTIIAEIGVNMDQFPSAAHLASWSGLCPGNNESAGKRRSGRTTKGNPYLRTSMVQAAWAASHTKDSYLQAQYHRLVKRLGKKKALVAVAHSLLVIVYQMLSKHAAYQDLGGDYFNRRAPAIQCKHLVEKLTALGYKVTVEPSPAAT